MKDMFRMRGLLKRIKALNDPEGFFIDWYKKEYEKGEIIFSFGNKDFLVDVRIIILQRLYQMFSIQRQSTPWSLGQKRKHNERISNVIEACIKRNYLVHTEISNWPDGNGGSITRSSTTHIKMSQDGIEFLQLSRFIEACLSEFPNMLQVVLSMFGGGVVLYIIQKVMEMFS